MPAAGFLAWPNVTGTVTAAHLPLRLAAIVPGTAVRRFCEGQCAADTTDEQAGTDKAR